MQKIKLISMLLIVLMLAGCGANNQNSTNTPTTPNVEVNESVETPIKQEEISESVEVPVEVENEGSETLVEDDKFKTYTITETETNTGSFNPLSADITLENWEEKCKSALGNIGLNKVFENDLISITTVATNLDSCVGEIPIIVTNKTNYDIIVHPIVFSWQEDTMFVNDIPCDITCFTEVPANGAAEGAIYYDYSVILLNNISSVQSFKVNLEIKYDDDTVGEPVETGLFEIRTKDYSKVDDEVQYVGRKLETKTEGLSIYDAGWVGRNVLYDNMADKILVVENNTDYIVSLAYSYRAEDIAREKNREFYAKLYGEWYFLPHTAGAVKSTYSNGTSIYDIYPEDGLVVYDLLVEVVVRDNEGQVIDSYDIVYEDSLDWNKIEIVY